MNTAVATRPVSHDFVSYAVTSAQFKQQIQLIQRVMADVMIEGVHYGRIAGMPKPSLLKPGAEVLCAVFRIAPTYEIRDLSSDETRHYHVICTGESQINQVRLGQGVGACSSEETKYAWRAPVCDEEFEETDEARRRKKWTRGNGGAYQQKQVRTEIADSENTVLKMACKRAQCAMVLNVTAASDIFAQDLEDLEGIADGSAEQQARRPARQANRSNRTSSPPQSTGGNGKITDGQKKLIFARLNAAGMSAEDLCKHFNVDSVVDLPMARVNDALAYIADPERAAIQAEGGAEQ